MRVCDVDDVWSYRAPAGNNDTALREAAGRLKRQAVLMQCLVAGMMLVACAALLLGTKSWASGDVVGAMLSMVACIAWAAMAWLAASDATEVSVLSRKRKPC